MKIVTDRNKEDDAIEKVQMILPLTNSSLGTRDRVALQKEIASKNGISYRTVGRYLEKYLKNGFSGLLPAEQKKDSLKKIPEEILKEAITIRRELDTRSVTDIIVILEGEGKIKKGSVKRSTLQRYLQKAGFSKNQMIIHRKLDGKSNVRFQKEHRNELWQGDIKYGPILPGKIQTYFIAWIDDCTRFVVACCFSSSQTEEDVLRNFRDAISCAGIPKACYVDNGSQYIAKDLKKVCSRLGIQLKHAPVRSGQSKGKIEAMNKHLDSFISECSLMKFKTIEELNAYLQAWIENGYHHKEHSALQHRSPYATFFNDTAPLKLVPSDILDQAFVKTAERVITDSTFSLSGTRYEVPNREITGKVTVCYGLEDTDSVLVCADHFDPVEAKPIIIGTDVDYENRNSKEKKWDKAPAQSSRLLEIYRKAFQNRHPDSPIFADADKAHKVAEPKESEPEKGNAVSFTEMMNKENK